MAKKKSNRGKKTPARGASRPSAPPPAAPAAPAPPPATPDGTSKGLVVGILVALGVATVAAAYLFYAFVMKEHGPAGFESACNFGEKLDCDKLNTSRYGKFGGDIPITVLAIPTYLAMAALALRSLRAGAIGRASIRLVAVGAAGAVLYGLMLLYVMVAIEETFCLFCLTMDVAALAVLVMSLLAIRAERGAIAPAWGPAAIQGLVVGFVVLGITFGTFLVIKALGGAEQIAIIDEGFDPSVSVEELDATPAPEEAGKGYKIKEHYYYVPVTDNDPQTGPADAKLTVIEFADFQCGYCKKLYYSMTQVKEKYRDEVRFVFKHYPMSTQCNENVTRDKHKFACGAAIASECARRQDRFWPMHDLMYKNQHKLEPDDLDHYAREVGLDMAEFKQCLKDPTAKARVVADANLGWSVDVKATPRTFVGGRYLKGALPASSLEHAIEQELGRRSATEKPQRAAAPRPTTIVAATADSMVRVDYGKPFWIDTFEASIDKDGRALSLHGVMPANSSWYEAAEACEAAGKRLCTTEEWVSACQGAAALDDDGTGSFADDYIEGNQFPYADYYEPRWCRDSQNDVRDAEGKVTKEGRPGKTGEKPRCATSDGIFDLGGNVAEWVGATEDDAILLGGDFKAGDKTGCYRPNPTWGPGHKNIRLGFRCCADEAVASVGKAVDATAPASIIGTKFEPFIGELMGGGTLDSASFEGKVTYLTFFASWCPPCRRELPALNELHDKYEPQGFQVIGVGVDTEASKSEKMARRYRVQYPVVLDPDNKILGQYDVKSMPTTYVIDRDGVIVEKIIGWGETAEKLPRVMEIVEKHL